MAAKVQHSQRRSRLLRLLFAVGIILCIVAVLPIVFVELASNQQAASHPAFTLLHVDGNRRQQVSPNPPQQQESIRQAKASLSLNSELIKEPRSGPTVKIKQSESQNARSEPVLKTPAIGLLLTPENITLEHLISDETFRDKPVKRGIAGRPLSQTPAVIGAKRAHIECPDLNVDSVAYWNDPPGTRDLKFTSPFASEGYISFSPDFGGWNNVRMSLEILFVLAAVTNRTLVLPPKAPLYLLQNDKEQRYKGIADFFPLKLQQRVKVISFEKFLEREGGTDGRMPVPETSRIAVQAAANFCIDRKKEPNFCGQAYAYLQLYGKSPRVHGGNCLIFDEDLFVGRNATAEHQNYIDTICGRRKRFVWTNAANKRLLWHFRAGEGSHRLLTHFYGMIHFTNPTFDNYYKRLVRDVLHYHDSIWCAAGKIVKALQAEGMSRGFSVDENGAGAYSALHVRRGDLQYKKVKISAQEWYDNTKEVWQPSEILYIATDERNKTFFDDLAKHHTLRFLDDYWDLAGLATIDPNYMGMIDTIVASRGRTFTGTWFSTFSGYINRMRGYYGLSMQDSWYSFLPKKEAVHMWQVPTKSAYAYEWPDGWIGIDADVWPSQEVF